MTMQEKEIEKIWEQLLKIAESTENQECGSEEAEGEIYTRYSLEAEQGRMFYESLEDEKLLEYLRKKTEELGRSPAQKEIFWILRSYIKDRFCKWPYALKAAGLCKAAGKGGKTLEKIQEEKDDYQQLLEAVREKARQICRIPHPSDLPEIHAYISKYASSWGKVMSDAGIDEEFFQNCAVYKIKNASEELQKDLESLEEMANKLHRPPLLFEINDELKERLISKCGSYRNALHQIGLVPIQKRNAFFSAKTGHAHAMGEEKRKGHFVNLQNCYYQVINPDAQTKKDLDVIYQYWIDYGKVPDRKGVDSELRKRLQQSCGSWANAIYQIHYRESAGE